MQIPFYKGIYVIWIGYAKARLNTLQTKTTKSRVGGRPGRR